MIRERKPRTIIEIGCGFSTFVARQALDDVHENGKLVCRDPEPRAEISALSGVEFIGSRVQDVPVSVLVARLTGEDFVFYDGSHTIKTGSDAVHFYLRMLPYLPIGLLVHAHDAPLPYQLPRQYLVENKLSWGEPYLLMAHLHNTRRYKVLISNTMLQLQAPGVLELLTAGKIDPGGSSCGTKFTVSILVKRGLGCFGD